MSDDATWYWLAVLGLTAATAVMLTLVWLDSPTKRERQIEEGRIER